MVIGEILAGITLVNSAAEQIKKLVGNANDVSSLGKHIDDFFEGERQVQKNKASAYNDTFSVKNIAEETINMKLAQERRDEMKVLLDMRFGHGTWAGILQDELLNTAGICMAILAGGGLLFLIAIWWSRQP